MKVILLLPMIFVSVAVATNKTSTEGDEVDKVPTEEMFNMDRIINKAAVRNRRLLWRNGVVPYVLSNSYSSQQRRVIASAMEEFRKHTCIRFVPRTNQRNFINIQKIQGCFSNIGMIGGGQRVSLSDGCVREITTPMHEFMHAIGFAHEQSREDRDRFVNINFNNIENPELRHNFEIADPQQFQLLTPYDYDSVMHYEHDAFGRGRTTITRKDGSRMLSNNRGFSELDIQKINILYRCSRR